MIVIAHLIALVLALFIWPFTLLAIVVSGFSATREAYVELANQVLPEYDSDPVRRYTQVRYSDNNRFRGGVIRD